MCKLAEPLKWGMWRQKGAVLTGLVVGMSAAFAAPSLAQVTDTLGTPQALLDGTDFNYQYQNGRAIHARFEGGSIQYRWIRGPNASDSYKSYPYQSRQIREDLIVLQWHEADLDNLITLVVDLDGHTVASSAIVRYRQDEPIIAFQGGTIENLTDNRK